MIEQTIFSTPLWHFDYKEHNQTKSNLINYLNEHSKNFNDKDYIHLTDDSHNIYISDANLHCEKPFESLINEIFLTGDDLRSSFKLKNSMTLGVSQMWGTVTKPGGFISRKYFPDHLFHGVYSLQTPKNSGLISLNRDNADKSYYQRIDFQEPNTKNCEIFKSFLPEGSVLLFPSNLHVSYTVNNSDFDRHLVHFTIKGTLT